MATSKRNFFRAAVVSAALVGGTLAPAPASAQGFFEQFISFFTNYQAIILTFQAQINPQLAATRVELINSRNGTYTQSLLARMYEINPGVTNEVLGIFVENEPTAGNDLVIALRNSGTPVSPT